MSDIPVRAGDSLQSALNTAQPGDTITLEAGATFVGQLKFPPKSGMVTVRSSGVLPDRRVGPDDAGQMATIVSGVAAMACDFYDSKNWTLDGIRFEPNTSGAGEVIGLWRSKAIRLRRLLCVVPESQQQKRFVLGNGEDITLEQSYVSGVWKAGQDSQCFVAWDGAGPYWIVDNFLEAASENVMFGGADSSSEANRPKGIYIEDNLFSKPLRWKGDSTVQVVKNLLEFKDGSRITVRGNTFEHNWGGEGQAGRSLLITPRNQDGTAPWTRVEDVLIAENTFRDIDAGFSITGYDDINPSGQTTDIVIRDNTIETRGVAFLLMSDIGNLEIYRNTVISPPDGAWLSMDPGTSWASGTLQPSKYAVRNLVLAENTAPGYIHSPTALNEAALKAYAETYRLTAPVDEPEPSDPPDAVELLRAELAAVKAESAAAKAKVDKLVAYLSAMPSATRIAQVVSYLRGASK